MAPIRPHNKTRSGCKTCKDRKVKCDECLPICQNCTRRGIECVWSSTGPSAALVLREPSSSNGRSTWAGPSSSDPLILELMHHYSTSASYSLSSDPEASRIWSSVIPKMAFDPQNQYLLHAILAFSALHMHHTDSTSLPRYAAAAHTFYQQAKIGIHSEEEGTADINAALMALCLVGRYEFASLAKLCPLSSSDSDWYITHCAIRRNIAKNRTESQDGDFRLLLRAMAPPYVPTNFNEDFPLSLSTLLSTGPDVSKHLFVVVVVVRVKTAATGRLDTGRGLRRGCKSSSGRMGLTKLPDSRRPRVVRAFSESSEGAGAISHVFIRLTRSWLNG
ncbi:uncharacterized protein BT62DRAFT_261992 [Guyanagaster necrorhizus]|uniref:Zn(2)-C6 fungal-type domain-containing protein n=1 Tax=Guyanagaster necrorhizus TaxID=856835 RepID=A0A9P8AXS7_9AGAR|nr:uncharacterized protein BT62DRAFT_261992 [Guyanagaster necrorhizus MCA 3950]KAG7451700.1 hypothetical protein BT62DRAFT_261992 [Guyanagaster necrorhizus MCA 3950]